MNENKTQSLAALLEKKAYPGRGIVLGRSADGMSSVAAYFIMGRSENSRNRVFEATEDGIRTRAHDPAKLEDPSLIIYHPVRKLGDCLIVTNGDQTDTIRDGLLAGKSFEQALESRAFEPDAPHFTSRISGLLDGSGNYRLSILKSADAAGSACNRHCFSYEALAGCGHLIHTYQDDGAPLPAFVGEPVCVALPNGAQELADALWASLNEANKISLYVRYTALQSGAVTEKLINKHGG